MPASTSEFIARGSIAIELIGWERFIRLLTLSTTNAPKIMAQALYEEALVIFAETQRVTPVRTGILRGSGHVTVPTLRRDGADLEIAYGGAAAPYAGWVHERTVTATGRFVYHAPPTKSKFLQDPVEAAQSDIDQRITRRVQGIFGAA